MERKENRLPVFTRRFRELQGERSNTEFADFLGLSRQTVGFYCNGDRLPDVITLMQIAEKCNVSTDYLLGRSDAKTADKNIQLACETTGLSVEAINALKFDSGQKKNRDIFAFEDFLIRELYVSFWALRLRDCVRNVVQVQSLQPKLGLDIVTDQSDFFRWKAMREFEESFNKAIEQFASLYSDDMKITDTNAYLEARKIEFENRLKRINELTSNKS